MGTKCATLQKSHYIVYVANVIYIYNIFLKPLNRMVGESEFVCSVNFNLKVETKISNLKSKIKI